MHAVNRLKEIRIHPPASDDGVTVYEFAYVKVFIDDGAEVGRAKPHWGNIKNTEADKARNHVIDATGAERSGTDILADGGIT